MLRKLYGALEEAVGAVLLAAACFVAVVQVAARYLLASPPAWTEEAATLLFAWLVFVGASLALKRKEHFALDVVVVRLPRELQRAVQFGVLLATLVFCLLLVVYGTLLTVDSWNVRTAVMEIRRTWLYAAVPLGGALMFVRTCEAIYRWHAAGSARVEGEP